MSNNAANGLTPRDLPALQALCRIRVRGRIKRYKNGKSIRAIARQFKGQNKLSHEKIRNILQHPDKPLSRKTMIKIVLTTNGNKKPIDRTVHRFAGGGWNKDAL